MSTSRNSARAAGLGTLLSAPTPPADQDPEFAAHKARTAQGATAQPDRRWTATDKRSGDELARVTAPDEATATAQVTEQTGRRTGFTVTELTDDAPAPATLPARAARTTGALAHRGGPAVLPRKRAQRIPRDKLTVQVPVAVLDGLDALTTRDDTLKYDEVEAALRTHLAAKGIDLDED